MTATPMTADPIALAKEMLEGCKGVTPGPWQVIEDRHPWSLPARPEYGQTKKSGEHTERQIATVAHHPQLKAPWPVVNLSMGVSCEPKQPIHMVAIDPKDAAHIARCSPENIRLLASTVISLAEEIERLRGERDAAREWATRWQSVSETICTIIGLGLLDADQIAGTVRSKFESAESQLAAAKAEIAGLKDALSALIAMVETSMAGLIHPDTREAFRPGISDLELRPDGSLMLSEVRALQSKEDQP